MLRDWGAELSAVLCATCVTVGIASSGSALPRQCVAAARAAPLLSSARLTQALVAERPGWMTLSALLLKAHGFPRFCP